MNEDIRENELMITNVKDAQNSISEAAYESAKKNNLELSAATFEQSQAMINKEESKEFVLR